MNKKLLGYQEEVCECCGQTKTVLYPLDKGTADMVKALAVAVRNKGINMVHIRKEMEVSRRDWSYPRLLTEGAILSSHTQNWIKAHKHGLVAQVWGEGMSGNWCLTRKGATFLKGQPVPKYAIQDKKTKHIRGYYEPEAYTVTVHELQRRDSPYWEGLDFDIQEGRIVKDLPVKEPETQASLL